MTDFKLDGLSPRVFEHIVQELAIGAISATVTPFGDGPDGGREGTFEGKTCYGTDEVRWNGYGIIQAKYKTRPESVALGGTWAIKELRKELTQFTRAKKRRNAPDYYIFATNVVLAPNEGGTKDKIIAILKEFTEKYGVKDFDIWDYDKLRTLISRDEKVRRSYLAWISPSDVLADLCDFFDSHKKDYYKIMLRYIQNELLADQYAKLEQAGDSKDEAIPLSQVFIDLPTSSRRVSMEAPDPQGSNEGPRFVQQIIHSAGIELKSQIQLDSQPDLFNDVNNSPRLRRGRYVLIGGPGQGKTTVSQYICQIFRCEILQSVPQHLLSEEARLALRNFLEKDNTTYKPAARRLPFRIVLSEFAKTLAQGTVQSLMGYLAHKLNAKSDIAITAADVEKIISQYPAIVILDGLDEVPSSTNREDLLSAVSGFSIDISTSNLDVLVVATSRPQGYNDEFASSHYQHQYLVPLSSNDAMDYGSRLARIRFGANADRYDKVVSRLQRALSKPATVRLMRTPLQVTILTLLVDRMGDPPDERWNLFKDYYQLIYDRETERDIPSVAVLKTNNIEIDVIHRRVGIALQVESEKSGSTDARLTVDQFAQLVEDYLREEGHQEPSLSKLKKQIIEAAANRLVFLVGLESGLVGFEIRSLQEFMAAEGITDAEDQHIYDRLRAIAPAPHWRNVYLFAAGKCFAERRYIRPTIEGICHELNDDPEDESLRSLMVGSDLALDLLEDGPARKAPLTRGGMTRLALKLLDTISSASTRLAGVCEEETRYIFLEELRARLWGSKTETNIAALECLISLVNRYGGEFEDLLRELVAQRRPSADELKFMIETATTNNSWLTDKLTELIETSTILLWPTPYYLGKDNHPQYGPWLIESAPNWIQWYLWKIIQTHPGASGQSVLRVFSGKSLWNIELRMLASSKDSDLIPPKSTPQTAMWNGFRLLGEFCMNPSKESLADVLRDVSSWRGIMSGPMSRLPLYPWPAAEALLACISDYWDETEANESADITKVLKAVENGEYGDTDEWLANEQRYSEGRDVRDIASESPVVATSIGGLFRFPFRSIGSRETARISSVGLSPLLEAFRAANSLLPRDFIGSLILDVARRVQRGQRIVPSTMAVDSWINEVLPVFIRRRRFIPSYFLDFFHGIELDNPIWNSAFREVTLHSLSMYHHTLIEERAKNGNMVSILSDYYSSHSECNWLLIPLANRLLDRDRYSRDVLPRDFDVDPASPAVVRLAAIVCQIIAGRPLDNMTEDIAKLVLTSGALDVICSAIIRRGLTYAGECEELMKLRHVVGRPDPELEPVLMGNYLRRPSGIATASEWERLDFPESLRRLLNA